jgi:ribosome biogenesis SPOUT family RNA methylase Rps3
MQKPIIVIEHCEPELYAWSLLEYTQLSHYIDHSQLWFTRISSSDLGTVKHLGRAFNLPASALVDPAKTIVLDPQATQELTSADLDHFDYFVIGGILGDAQFNQRTGTQVTSSIHGAQLRHLGPKQFSVDNAVFVTLQILSGKSLSDMHFVDELELEFSESESVSLPYRYPVIDGKPLINPDLITHLRDSDDF